MTTKLFSLAGIAVLFFSCSDDKAKSDTQNPPTVFTHFTTTSATTLEDGSLSTNSYTYTENLIDQKRHSVLENGVNVQKYFYANGLVAQAPLGFSFDYDTAGKVRAINRLIGEDGIAQELKYHFAQPIENVMYCERMVWADVPTEIAYRNILEFDADGNVIKTGPDANLDGVMDHVNTFTYSNGDLTNVQLFNGSSRQFSYLAVRDNFCWLDDNTYGKRVRRAMCSEYYAGSTFETNLGHSEHVLATDTPLPTYILFDSGFYQKRTTFETFIDNSQNETVTEFFVD